MTEIISPKEINQTRTYKIARPALYMRIDMTKKTINKRTSKRKPDGTPQYISDYYCETTITILDGDNILAHSDTRVINAAYTTILTNIVKCFTLKTTVSKEVKQLRRYNAAIVKLIKNEQWKDLVNLLLILAKPEQDNEQTEMLEAEERRIEKELEDRKRRLAAIREERKKPNVNYFLDGLLANDSNRSETIPEPNDENPEPDDDEDDGTYSYEEDYF